MAVGAHLDGPLSPSKKMTAAKLMERLQDGERSFSGITITDDFTWHSVTRGDLNIQGNVSLCRMIFTGECHIGDLSLSGDLYLAGSIFYGRSVLYNIVADGISAQQARFERGAALLNSRAAITDFLGAQFPGDERRHPAGLLIKQSEGRLLRLNGVTSVQTIFEQANFQTITEEGSELGRRTSLTLGELMA